MATSAPIRQQGANNPAGVSGDILKHIKAGNLTSDQLIAWMDKHFPGQHGFLTEYWLKYTFIPLLTLIKKYDPTLFGKIEYDTRPGSEAIGIWDNPHTHLNVYPIDGVKDPDLKERIGQLFGKIKDIPVIKQTIETGEFLFKLGQFILDPVRMGELVIGVLLIAVGVNAILHNPAGAVANAAPTKMATKAVRGAR